MHQIYSCSDENLEVFTTVISSKSCSPARRRAKSTHHVLTKSVVAIADHRLHRTEKLQAHQGDLLQVLYSEEEMRGLGHLQSGQQRPCPAKCAAQHAGITERDTSKSYNHLLDGKSLFPPSPVTRITVKAAAATDLPTGAGTPTEDHRKRWRKMAEYDLALPPGAEASLPLTGGSLCGTPSLLRKMWMKNKKKSEYLGATNSAFEAD
ncbi:vexin [Leptosomus discolor]